LNSWDTAAGILMITEAGGAVTDLRGAWYRPGGPELLVSNGHIHAEMQQMMAEVAEHATKM
jgi:myo-inositol-1(or 4)-monophosphatase